MAYQYEKTIQAIQDEEKKRKEQDAKPLWQKFAEGTGNVAHGVGSFLADVAQSIPRGVVNIGLTIDEAQRNQNLDERNNNIDRILKIDKDRRKKLLEDFKSPERSAKMSDQDWSDAFLLNQAEKNLGSIDDAELKKRKEANTAEGKTHKTYKADNGLTKFLLGGEDDEVAQSAQKTNEDVKKWGEGIGLNSGQSTALGLGAAIGGTALDAPTGIGSLVKSPLKALGKKGIKDLVVAGTEEEAKAIVKKAIPKASDEVLNELAPQLARATDAKTVKELLRNSKPLTESLGAAIASGKDSLIQGAKDVVTGDVSAGSAKALAGDVLDTGVEAGAKDAATLAAEATAKQEAQGLALDGTEQVVKDATGNVVEDTTKQATKTSYGPASDKLLGNLKTSSELKDMTKKKVGTELKEQFVDKLSPVNDLVKTIEQRTGQKLSTEDNPYELMRLFNGMPDAVQQRVSTLTNILKEAPDLDAVKIIGLSRQIRGRAERGITSFISKDEAHQAIQETYDRLGQEGFDKASKVVDAVNEYNRGLLSDLHEAGIISDDAFRAIQDTGADYFSRFNVVDYIMKNDANRALFAKTGSYNTTKQAINKVLAKSKGMAEDTNILDPIEAIVRSTDLTMRNIAKNNIWHAFNRLADVAPDLVTRIREPENVIQRIAISLDNKELRPIRNKLNRMISTRGQWVRKLESQINQLEKKGLNTSLKNGGERMTAKDFVVGGLGGKVPTSQTGKFIKRNITSEPTTFFRGGGEGSMPRGISAEDIIKYERDELGNADIKVVSGVNLSKIKSNNLQWVTDTKDAAKEYGKVSPVSFDNFRIVATDGQGGKLLEVLPAKKASDFVDIINPQKLGPSDTGKFIRNLIENGSQKDIDKLKRMVGTRDAKLTSLLDELTGMKSEYDNIAGTIRGNSKKIADLKDAEVPDGMELISGFGKGIQGKLAVPKEIAEVFTGKSKAQQDYLTSFMGRINSFVKQNFTSNNIAFALFTNPARDIKSFAMNSKNVASDPLSIFKAYSSGLFGRILQDKDYKAMIAAGGKSGFYSDERTAVDLARDLTRTISGTRVLGVKVAPIKNAKDLIRESTRVLTAPLRGARDALHGAASILEDAPRLAEYKAAKKMGKSDLGAAFDARNVTVDFQQAGRVGQVVNAWIPFLNARFQGTLKSVEAVKSNPARALSVYATLTAAPIIAAEVNNNRFPDVLKNISEDERQNNFIIVLGDAKNKEGRYTQVLKIPKSDVDKILGNPLEQMVRWAYKDDPDTLQQTLINMVGNTLPFDTVKDGQFNMSRTAGSVLPPIIKAPVENATNHNFYFDSQIVPDKLLDLPNSEQVKPNTSMAARLVSSITGGSPMKTDNTIRNLTGTVITKNPIDQVTGKAVGASGNKMNDEFYSILNNTKRNRASASKYINEAIGRGDTASAMQAAQAYNKYLKEQFTPFAGKFGRQMTKELADTYDEQKIVLTNRSIKQRQRNQLERQAVSQ